MRSSHLAHISANIIYYLLHISSYVLLFLFPGVSSLARLAVQFLTVGVDRRRETVSRTTFKTNLKANSVFISCVVGSPSRGIQSYPYIRRQGETLPEIISEVLDVFASLRRHAQCRPRKSSSSTVLHVWIILFRPARYPLRNLPLSFRPSRPNHTLFIPFFIPRAERPPRVFLSPV